MPEATLLSYPRLVADIGGTNARFGLQMAAGAPISHIDRLACADHATPDDAVAHYLKQVQITPAQACLAVATAINPGEVTFTNSPWRFTPALMQARFGWQRLRVINDFTALALGVTQLPPHELTRVGPEVTAQAGAIAVIGPGTGLGVSGLVPCGNGHWHPLQGEGGHVTLAAGDALEASVIEHLRSQWPHISAERLLCGTGLRTLHEALAAVAGRPNPSLSPEQIMALGCNGEDAHCEATLHRFCGLLGSVAGNLALTLGAVGGVYLGGGLLPRMGALVHRSPLRTRFEAKGRFDGYLSRIPMWIIKDSAAAALAGAALALEDHRATH